MTTLEWIQWIVSLSWVSLVFFCRSHHVSRWLSSTWMTSTSRLRRQTSIPQRVNLLTRRLASVMEELQGLWIFYKLPVVCCIFVYRWIQWVYRLFTSKIGWVRLWRISRRQPPMFFGSMQETSIKGPFGTLSLSGKLSPYSTIFSTLMPWHWEIMNLMTKLQVFCHFYKTKVVQ